MAIKKADFLKELDAYLEESAANRVKVEAHLLLAKNKAALINLVGKANCKGLVSIKAKQIAALPNGKKVLKGIIKDIFMDEGYILVIKQYL